MPLQITGECNHCGRCCLHRRKGGMLFQSPMIDINENQCKFYTDEGAGHCLIQQSVAVLNVKDRKGNLITKMQIDYFFNNCVDWPHNTFDRLSKGKDSIPDYCSFKLEEK